MLVGFLGEVGSREGWKGGLKQSSTFEAISVGRDLPDVRVWAGGDGEVVLGHVGGGEFDEWLLGLGRNGCL